MEMKLITKGSSRLVFLIGNYALKIPRVFVEADDKFYGKLYTFLKGWQSNRYEYLWSKSNLYDFLLPVKFSVFYSIIIIMDKATELTVDEFSMLDEADYNFKRFEFKLDSFGKLNNKNYIIDYGN